MNQSTTNLPLHIQALKQRIWEAARQDLAKVQAAQAAAGVNDGSERYWKAVLRKVKPVKTKEKIKLTPDQYKRFRDAKYAWFAKEFPHCTKDGHYLEPDNPDMSTANGITGFIEDYLQWTGHFSNRTGNEGRVIIKDGEPKRIPSQSKNGMQDIDCNLKHDNHEFGIPWKIEVKAPGDTHKDHQKKFGEMVKKTGGVYSVVRSADDFFSQYDSLMVTQKVLF